VRHPTKLDARDVWARFHGKGGVFRGAALDARGPGDRFELATSDGERLTGRTLVHSAPLEFAGTLEGSGDGMLRFGFEDCMGAPEAHVWIATWGLKASEFEALERRWTERMQHAFSC
jgi:hypothetical protein